MTFYILTRSENPNLGFKSTFTTEWRLDWRAQGQSCETRGGAVVGDE